MQAAAEPEPSGSACGDLNFPLPSPIPLPDDVTQNTTKWEHLQLTHDEALQTERETRDQHQSQKWHDARKNRMTASTFGRYMNRQKVVTEAFLKSIFNKKQFTSAPTSYGISNEKTARQMYAKSQKVHVHDCGLVINPDFPFLGASPDGKVCDQNQTGILEIKCPYSARDKTVQEAVDSYPNFFMERHGQSLRLKRNHAHWYQVQGQLLVTGAAFCDFVTYTKIDTPHVERIFPDTQTMHDLLVKLTGFYVNNVRDFINK